MNCWSVRTYLKNYKASIFSSYSFRESLWSSRNSENEREHYVIKLKIRQDSSWWHTETVKQPNKIGDKYHYAGYDHVSERQKWNERKSICVSAESATTYRFNISPSSLVMFKDFVYIRHMKSRVATKLQRTRDTSISNTEKQKPSWSRACNLNLLEQKEN
jgi:hypothetical protein